MLGHSLGEYVAACLAGVFNLEHAARIVAVRAKLMSKLNEGSMLAVHAPLKFAREFDSYGVELAAMNAPNQFVLGGNPEAIERVQSELTSRGVRSRLLPTSHAFHTSSMNPILNEFSKSFDGVKLSPPTIPFVSSRTGQVMKNEEAMDSNYWILQLRNPVCFQRGVETIAANGGKVWVEVGPGRGLSSLIKACDRSATVLSTIPENKKQAKCLMTYQKALGKLWELGFDVDLHRVIGQNEGRRIPLPGYPFEREIHWVDRRNEKVAGMDFGMAKRRHVSEFIHLPKWRQASFRSPHERTLDRNAYCWIILGEASELIQRLEAAFCSSGEQFVQAPAQVSESASRWASSSAVADEAYGRFLTETLGSLEVELCRIIYVWCPETSGNENDFYELNRKLYQVIRDMVGILRGVSKGVNLPNLELTFISREMYSIFGNESVDRTGSAIPGLLNVAKLELPRISFRQIDVDRATEAGFGCFQDLLAELRMASNETALIALRGNQRWALGNDPLPISESKKMISWKIRVGGIYLITGGLGNIGLQVAEWLAKKGRSTLVLLSRSPFPEREDWSDYLRGKQADKKVCQQIRKLQSLEGLGSHPIVVQADVGCLEDMEMVSKRIHREPGQLAGVFHAAGVVPKGKSVFIKDAGDDLFHRYFQAKVNGTLILDQLFNSNSCEFFVLFSSLSSLLGGLGYGPYASSNAFLDSFAHFKKSVSDRRWISINWDAWDFESLESDRGGIGRSLKAFALQPEEGIQALDLVMQYAKQMDRCIVSGVDLKQRFEVVRAERNRKEDFHERPADIDSRQPPEPSRFWEQVLGLEAVRDDDDFFELGGDSLTAIQLITLVNESLGLNLDPNDLLQNSRFEQFSARVEQELRRKEQILDRKKSPPVFKIRGQNQDGPALFLFPPAGGQFVAFHDLLEEIPKTTQIFGVDTRKIGACFGSRIPTLEELAGRCAQEILSKSCKGLYFFCGMSFGGAVAFETAKLLAGTEKKAELVALLDSELDGGKVVAMRDRAEIIYGLLCMSGQETVTVEQLKSMDEREQIETFIRFQSLDSSNVFPEAFDAASSFLQEFERNVSTIRSYRPEGYGGKIVLFLAEESAREDRQWLRERWRQAVDGEFECITIPGNHLTMNMHPNGDKVVSRLMQEMFASKQAPNAVSS